MSEYTFVQDRVLQNMGYKENQSYMLAMSELDRVTDDVVTDLRGELSLMLQTASGNHTEISQIEDLLRDSNKSMRTRPIFRSPNTIDYILKALGLQNRNQLGYILSNILGKKIGSDKVWVNTGLPSNNMYLNIGT